MEYPLRVYIHPSKLNLHQSFPLMQDLRFRNAVKQSLKRKHTLSSLRTSFRTSLGSKYRLTRRMEVIQGRVATALDFRHLNKGVHKILCFFEDFKIFRTLAFLCFLSAQSITYRVFIKYCVFSLIFCDFSELC